MNGHNSDGNPIIGYSDSWENSDERNKIWLGHSCDRWVIGNIEEAKKFVEQLQAVIDKAEKEPEEAIEPNEF